MEIKDFIKDNGEPKFRELEKSVVEEVSKKNNSIISTGGGVILNKINILWIIAQNQPFAAGKSSELLKNGVIKQYFGLKDIDNQYLLNEIL